MSGSEPHYILHECFYKGENIAVRELGGFDGNIPIHSDGWRLLGEVTKEVKYYVKFSVPDSLKLLMSDENYLNYGYGMYFFNTNEEFDEYKTKFTRDEIEEFGMNIQK